MQWINCENVRMTIVIRCIISFVCVVLWFYHLYWTPIIDHLMEKIWNQILVQLLGGKCEVIQIFDSFLFFAFAQLKVFCVN